MTITKLVLAPLGVIGILAAGTSICSATTSSPALIASTSIAKDSATVLARHGADDGAGHDVGDDHGGGKGRGGADDGANHT